MLIKLSPQRRDDTLTVVKSGDVLTINGDELDLSAIPDGATVRDAWQLHSFLTGEIQRVNGEIEITFILPHGPNPSQSVAFPEPIVNPSDGTIELPFDPQPEQNDENPDTK